MSHTGVMQRRTAQVARRRVAAHACPECRRPWALRGIRTDAGSWVIVCSSCGWHDVRGADAGSAAAREPTPAPAESPCSHGVLLYEHTDQLLDAVEDYLVTGWSSGGVGVVIATAENRRALRSRLVARGLGDSLGGGRLVELDVHATLAQIMRDGSPDPVLFDRTVGSLLNDHAAGTTLRGFGEMVDVLWAAGNAVGALQLERLWSALQERVRLDLLCAYATTHVDPEDRATVTRAHDRVVA